jgi:phosphoribosylformimino-5-aminoimidazole carboxamide ribotide isomerase
VFERAIEVIPVIDLRGGVVVHARHGSRHSYAPIVTPLARTSAPLDVVAGFLTVHPFRTIYAADLDRIENRGNHDQCLDALSTAFPDVSFWADAGVRDGEEARSFLARHKRAHLVLGSESLSDHAVLEEFTTDGRVVLSLDYRRDRFLGPKGICDAPHLWPARVIVMTLARVGGDAGPDMDHLAKIKRRAPDIMLYAAGGLRGVSDLIRLKQAGIRGVLVASALHDGRLAADDLAAAASKGAGEEK